MRERGEGWARYGADEGAQLGISASGGDGEMGEGPGRDNFQRNHWPENEDRFGAPGQ